MAQSDNITIITDIMEYSRHGALAQMFIVDAISKWSKLIAEKPIEELRAQFGENSFIGAEAWKSVAVEIKAKMDAAYGRKGGE